MPMKIQKKQLILALLLPIQVVLVHLASKNPAIIEQYYANGIYPVISSFLRIIFGWLPFSLGDLLIGYLLFLFFRFFIRLIASRFRYFIPKTIHFTAVLSMLYFCFYLFWGLNYYREPLAKNMQYPVQKYTTNQLEKVSYQIVEKLNSHQFKITKNDTTKVVNILDQKKMYALAELSYQELSREHPQFTYQHVSVKNSLMSWLQMYNGTAGYLNPFTGEAQVNDRIPKTGYPTTICHEIAHQIGFAAENEANFIGFLAANYSTNLYFKYASYRMAFAYCLAELRKRDPIKAKRLWSKMHTGVGKDFRASYASWEAYKNPLEPLIKKGYSSYLKANKQKNGIDSYNQVVDLLVFYFESKQEAKLP
jgi:hypothetical protein